MLIRRLKNRVRTFIRTSFFRYVVAGGLTALAEFLILVMLIERFGFDALVANVIAFVVVNIANYLVSRHWVFEKTGMKKSVEFFLFTFVLTLGLSINQLVFWFFIDTFAMDYKIAKVLSLTFVVFWNFLTRKHLVFRKKFQPEGQA